MYHNILCIEGLHEAVREHAALDDVLATELHDEGRGAADQLLGWHYLKLSAF